MSKSMNSIFEDPESFKIVKNVRGTPYVLIVTIS